MHHLLLRFHCLHEVAILTLLLRFYGPILIYFPLHLHFSDYSSGALFSSWWSAMEYRRCQPPFAHFIVRDDPHSKCVKCMGLSHACEAIYGVSKCKFCENLHLKTLCSRLDVFLCHAPEASAAFRESVTWGSDVELETMESEQTGLALSLPLSPEHVRASSPVEYAHNYLYPSPEARDTVSLGLEDVLFTAASDSEDFGPALADALAPSGGVAFRGQLWARGSAFARHRKALYRLAWWAPRVSIVQTRRAFP